MLCCSSIGFAVARRLGLDGAKVMISSRKEMNVIQAVHALKKENIEAAGVTCHAGRREDIKDMLKTVNHSICSETSQIWLDFDLRQQRETKSVTYFAFCRFNLPGHTGLSHDYHYTTIRWQSHTAATKWNLLPSEVNCDQFALFCNTNDLTCITLVSTLTHSSKLNAFITSPKMLNFDVGSLFS